MGFMQRYVYKGRVWLVETSNGTDVVPFEVCGSAEFEDLAPYVEGEIESVEERDGFYGRYSADGYMDCTSWDFDESESALEKRLADMYGDDEDNEN